MPPRARPPNRHCRAVNNATARTANCGFTSVARTTMIVTRRHRRRRSATRKTSPIGARNPTELPRSIAAHAGMAAAPNATKTTTRSRPRAPRAAQTAEKGPRSSARADNRSAPVAARPAIAREARTTDAASLQPPDIRPQRLVLPRHEHRVGPRGWAASRRPAGGSH